MHGTVGRLSTEKSGSSHVRCHLYIWRPSLLEDITATVFKASNGYTVYEITVVRIIVTLVVMIASVLSILCVIAYIIAIF